MDNQEWLAWRNKGIGGSESSALLGLNPYMNNVQLWEKKVLGKEKEFKNPEVLERGHAVEPLIRELFKIDHPELIVEYKDNDHYTHPKYPFIRATLDGRISSKDNTSRGVLEIKHVQLGGSVQREKWKGSRLPQNYFCQVLQYLEVYGADYAIVKVRFRNDFEDGLYITEKEYTIYRKDHLEDIKILIDAIVEFWVRYVMTKKRPPLILPQI